MSIAYEWDWESPLESRGLLVENLAPVSLHLLSRNERRHAQPRTSRATVSTRVRNRRILLVGLTIVMLFLLAIPMPATGGRSVTNPLGSLPTVSIGHSGSYYVVQPGDTLRSIAKRIDSNNPGPVQKALQEEVGSTAIVVGEHIHLPL